MVQAQTGVTDFRENMEALKHNFLLSGYFKKRGYEDSAEVGANEIVGLPQATPTKSFTFTARQLFGARDSAKLRDQKSLNAGGEFLAQNQFGFAVVTVSTGTEGDTQKDMELTEARAMVVRDYLVDNFGFDDSQLKTLGLGKQAASDHDADWGSIQILVYPLGTEIPRDKPASTGTSSSINIAKPVQVTTAGANQP
jgi:hypothetical protein